MNNPNGFFCWFDTFIDFYDGKICFQTGYECEKKTLNSEQSKQFFLFMMNYFRANGDMFWEEK